MARAPVAIVTPTRNRAHAKATRISNTEFIQLLIDAERAAAELGAAYATTVGESADRLARLAAAAQATDPADPKIVRQIADLAFELRGEGGSFGYDVISDVAGSLYSVVDGRTLDRFSAQVVDMHARALKSLIAGGVRRAAEDPVAAEILGALAEAKQKAAG